MSRTLLKLPLVLQSPLVPWLFSFPTVFGSPLSTVGIIIIIIIIIIVVVVIITNNDNR